MSHLGRPVQPILRLDIQRGATRHERCIVIRGVYTRTCLNPGDFVTVLTHDPSSNTLFPPQTWPITARNFKAVVILSPGENVLTFRHSGEPPTDYTATLVYEPCPDQLPVRLAILVARDSPLNDDALDIAVAKLRLAASLWQAVTEAELSVLNIRHRSFRLEEGEEPDTISYAFQAEAPVRLTTKVHVLPVSQSLAELRDASINNPHHLQLIILDALRESSAPFAVKTDEAIVMTLAVLEKAEPGTPTTPHASHHDPASLSFALFSSTLLNPCPSILEDVVPNLQAPLDSRPHPSRGYAMGLNLLFQSLGNTAPSPPPEPLIQNWPRTLIAIPSASSVSMLNLSDGPRFWEAHAAYAAKHTPPFRRPHDVPFEAHELQEEPVIRFVEDHEQWGPTILISCGTLSIAWMDWFGASPEGPPPPSNWTPVVNIHVAQLIRGHARGPGLRGVLPLEVVAENGRRKKVDNLWALVPRRLLPPEVRCLMRTGRRQTVFLPDSELALTRQSLAVWDFHEDDEIRASDFETSRSWSWATLLRKKAPDGTILDAAELDIRTGCVLDGMYVFYPDGERVNCGPLFKKNGVPGPHHFGGHVFERFAIPQGQEIARVELFWAVGSRVFSGLKIHFLDGTVRGRLSGHGSPKAEILEPEAGHRIIGFSGRSWWGEQHNAIFEFAIITAPNNGELPDAVYEMHELQNTYAGHEKLTEAEPESKRQKMEEAVSEDGLFTEDDGWWLI